MTVRELREILETMNDDDHVEIEFYASGDESEGWYESTASEVVVRECGSLKYIVIR